MLNQTDLYIERTDLSNIWSDLAVKVHGFLMSQLPTEYAEELHNGGLQPFSIFCYYGDEYGIVRISAMNAKAIQILDTLSFTDNIRVFGINRNIRVLKTERAPTMTPDDFSVRMRDRERVTVDFVSPAMYKSAGRLRCDPNFPAYFESVIQKLDKFEGIQITRETVNEAFRESEISRYKLFTDTFISGKKHFSGMTGRMTLTFPKDEHLSDVMKTLLCYATYSGIGGMTTQGMGGITIK